MDVLYIVGTGSKHDNLELRWSLRSLAKFGRGVGRVIVADLDEAGVVIEECGGCHETEDAGKCDCQSGNFFEHKTYFLSLSLPIEAVYTYIISES